jgi:pimeloyl-ACP methyl ester carboxylesterase
MKKAIKYGSLLVLLVVLIAVYLILSMEQRINNQALSNEFNSNEQLINIHNINDIRLWQTDDEQKNVVLVFIHGAPGSGDQFNIYLMDSTLRSKSSMITLDRPGYGYSSYGNDVSNINEQSELIHHSLSSVIDSSQKILFISHSFGGPIAALIGINYPQNVIGHLMLNPVIDPNSEPMFWFSELPLWWPFRYFSSGAMKVASHEKMMHPDELNAISQKWIKNTIPTLMIQGKKDWLAPLGNVDFVKNNFPNGTLEMKVIDEYSHFIPFSQKDFVVDQIISMMDFSKNQDN